MKKTMIRRVLALIMVLSLIPCWGVSAWADEPLVVDGTNSPQTVDSVTINAGANTAVSASAPSGETAEATVNKSVSIAGTGSTTGVKADSTGGSLDVFVGEDVSAGSTGSSSTGIAVSSSGGGTSTVEVKDDVTATSSSSSATGVKVSSSSGGTASVIIDGRPTAISETDEAIALEVIALDGSANAAVGGTTTATGANGAIGAVINLRENGQAEVETGAINAESTGSGDAKGTYVISSKDGGSADLYVHGDISSTSSGSGNAVGASLAANSNSTNSDIKLEVEGNISGSDTGLEIYDRSKGGTTITALVKKDVSGGETGLHIVEADSESNIFVGIEGIVSNTDTTGGAPIVVSDSLTAIDESLNLSIWKVEPNDAGHLVMQEDGSGNLTYGEKAQAVEKNINYIIKYDTSIADLGGVQHSAYAPTAREGDTVTILKINVPDGYKLTGAYNGSDYSKEKLYQDAAGNYYVKVPFGGGVYLSASFEKLPEIFVASSSGGGESYIDYAYHPYSTAKVHYANVTFDLNGGHTLSGNPGPVVKSVPIGTWVVLLEAPSKSNSTFEFWHTDDKSVKVSAPFASFEVTDDITFTAKWVGEELPYAPTEEEQALVSGFSVVPMSNADIIDLKEEEPVVEAAPAAAEDVTPVEPEAESAQAPVEETNVTETLPGETAAAETPVDTAPASDSSMMIEAMTTLTAATEALQAATEALIANNAPAAVETEAATETPVFEEAQPATEEAPTALDEARDELQRITEELEAAKSELKATTEELNSAKSELKATTEELSAAKDELKATTDELAETKAALRAGAEELTAAREEFLLLLAELKAQVFPSGEAEEELSSTAEVEEGTPSADTVEKDAPAEETAEPAESAVEEAAAESTEGAPAEQAVTEPTFSAADLNADSSTNSALVFSLGDGNTVELPVNISLSLAESLD